MIRLVGFLPTAAGLYACLGGLITIAGWAANVPRLADWDGDGITMQPNAGVCALLTGTALMLVGAGWRKSAAAAGTAAVAIGAATLFQHASGIDLGIDRLLQFHRPWGSRGTVAVGRMGVPAASSWTLAGLALILLRERRRTHAAVPAIGLLVSSIAGLSLIGYLFGADPLYTLPRATAIALQTATMVFAVGVGLVTIAPDRQPMQILVGDSAASALARRALPVVIVLPVVLGYLCDRGQVAQLYDFSMGTALLVLLLIITHCTLLWSSVKAVNSREQSLRISEDRFARFMQHLPGLAWIKDSEGRYLYANEAAERAFNVARDQLYGKTDEDCFPPETAALFRANDRAALLDLKGVQVVETLLHPDDEVHHSIVSKFPIAGDNRERPLIGGIAIDITDRKRAEETIVALLRISKRLNSTLSVDGLLEILVQEAMSLVGADAGVAGLLGPEGMVATKYFQQDQVIPLDYCWPPMHGLPGWLIVHKKPYLTNDAAGDKQIVRQLCERSGVRSALATPIITAQGDVVGFFELHNKNRQPGFTPADQEILLAVSQSAAIAVQNALAYRSLEEAEASLKQSDRRKDEFLAMLAHELRNPLAPIRNGLAIIAHATDRPEVVQEAREAMERQVKHLVRLVDDLLDLSRISRDKLELRRQRVELADVLRHAIATIQSTADCDQHHFELVLPQQQLGLMADSVRLTQVFSNLLNNACKFSDAGSKVTLAAAREGDEAVVIVSDTGLGIPPDQLGHVFEMFTQIHRSFERSLGGLGIGLTLVRRLVEMHGGTITAHSKGHGHGSEFHVRLPLLTEDSAASSERGQSPPVDSVAKLKFLVVDDNRDAAITLGTLLRLTGNEVALAHDGVEACEMAETLLPDVILLDIGLPRRNGYEACRAIRQTAWGRAMTIVALTGWGQEEDRRKSVEAGFDAHVVKPVEHEALMKLLADLLPPPACPC